MPVRNGATAYGRDVVPAATALLSTPDRTGWFRFSMTHDAHVTTAAGVRMPRLIYGTAWKKDATARHVRTAIAHGFRGIDTACQPKHYDEAGVGAGVADAIAAGVPRAELYLQTKFTPVDGQDPARIPYDANAPLADQVAQSFAASRRNLRVDVIDGLVLHSPLADLRRTLHAWTAMEALVDAGGVRQLGISNCYDLATLTSVHDAARIKPVIVQNRFRSETGYDRGIRTACRARGIVYQSFWTLTANPQVLASATVRAIAAAHARAPAQVLFRWLVEDGVVPLTGTTSETHMREDLAVFDFALTADERRAIAALGLA
jgi:diketogulonate reductase-like aldo/keto reductase